MVDLTFILVTISLGVLILISFQMKIPRAAFPLGIIYLIFVMFGNYSSDNNQQSNDSISDKNFPNNIAMPNTIIQSKPIRLNQKRITPKPINFDSGRTAKDLTNTDSIIQKKENIKKPESRPSNTPVIEENINELIIRDIAICKKIENRQPIGTDIYFTNFVDSLFCYTRIQNLGPKQEVRHNWYYKDKLIQPISYNVRRSNIYRSWTKKTILPHQIGVWRVDVLNKNNKILASKEFHITQ